MTNYTRSLSSVSALVAGALLLGACATTSSIPARAEFTDVPVPEGFMYRPGESGVIESPSVKAVRMVYRGRSEPDSLATTLRASIEANGWRHLATTMVPGAVSTQVYEKAGDSLQVRIWEGGFLDYYTYVEYSAGRQTRKTASSQ